MKKSITKAFNVSVETDEHTGTKIQETWTLNGKLHRDDGQPAWQQWDAKTGAKTDEGYYVKGELHRIGGPARIEWDAVTGVVIRETWAEYGCIHRENDKPASWMMKPETGVVTMEQYWMFGVQHRRGAPAEIWRDPDTGAVTDSEYYHMGERKTPPAHAPSNLVP